MSRLLFLLLASAFPVSDGPWQRHVIDPATDDLRGADGVRLGDVNADGRLDVVTGWEEGMSVRIAVQPAVARVREPWPAVTVGLVPDAEDAVPVDLDGDGAIDVVSCTEGRTKTVFVHWAPKDPGAYLKSSAWETLPVPATTTREAWMFALPMDVDGKNGVDLVVGSKGANGSVSWLESPPDPRDVSAWKLHRIRPAGWVMSLRFTGRGHERAPVLISDRKGSTHGIYRLTPDGDGTWKSSGVGGRGSEVMFLDVFPGSLRPLVATRNGYVLDFSLDSALPERIPNPNGIEHGKAVRLGDVDGDGALDIVHTANTSGRADVPGVTWLERTKDGWRTHDVSGPEGSKFDRIELVDLDADGDLDVITCEENFGPKSRGLGVIWYENPTAP